MIRVRPKPRLAVIPVVMLALLSAAAFPAWSAASAPAYTAEGLVNAATQVASALSPNTIATLYGANLAFSTHSVSASDLRGGVLPTSLDGVTVYVGGRSASLLYISPTQINFLIPYELIAGTTTVVVARQGLAGPTLKIPLNSTSPGLFPWNGNYAIASHLSGAIIGPQAPAKPGEIVILYAVGLGRTVPESSSGRVATGAATILDLAQLQVTIAGVAIQPKDILYAGLAPGFAGLYQVNLRMPDTLPPDPEIRLSVASQISPPKIQLAAEPSVVAAK